VAEVAVVLSNQGLDRAGEVAATTKAYDLRDQLPERERLGHGVLLLQWKMTATR
jgi:hypothetical protein